MNVIDRIEKLNKENAIHWLDCKSETGIALLRLAKLGQSVTKGVSEIMRHTACKGVYKSDTCNEINNRTYGCVLKYYCLELHELPKEAE